MTRFILALILAAAMAGTPSGSGGTRAYASGGVGNWAGRSGIAGATVTGGIPYITVYRTVTVTLTVPARYPVLDLPGGHIRIGPLWVYAMLGILLNLACRFIRSKPKGPAQEISRVP